MSILDPNWFIFKAKAPWYASTDQSYDEGFEEPPENIGQDSPEMFDDFQQPERQEAPSLDANQMFRLTRPQLEALIENANKELQRRQTKRADRKVAVMNNRKMPTPFNEQTMEG